MPLSNNGEPIQRRPPGLPSPYQRSSYSKEEVVQVRIRNKNNVATSQMGSMSQTLDEQQRTEKKRRDLSHATQRLKVLEQLERYREEKVQHELAMLELQRL
jgi:hypothetical protein